MQFVFHRNNVSHKFDGHRSNKRNVYDFIIIATIISIVFAGDLFRAFTPIILIGFSASIVFFFRIKKWTKYLYPRIKSILFFFFFLLLYSITAIMWITDLKQYMISVIWLYCFIFDFLLLFYCSLRAQYPIKSITIGWIFFLVINLVCAFWEITTGNHLSAGSYFADTNKFRIYAAVTYGNYNSLSIVLCLCLLFNLLYMSLFNKLRNQILSIILIVCIFIVLLINTSRGSLLCFALYPIPLWYTIKHVKSLKYLVLILFLGVIGFIWYEYSSIIISIIEEQLNARSNPDEDPRWKLWSAGLNIANQWWYIGSGPGSMVYEYSKRHIFIFYAHNLWIQMLVEYGLLLTVCFVIFCFRLIRKTLFTSDLLLRIIGLFLIFCWPVLTIIDEAYLKSIHWIFFASIVSIIYCRKLNINE